MLTVGGAGCAESAKDASGWAALSQAEDDMNRGAEVNRVATALCGLEANLFSGVSRSLVEAVAETADDTKHVDAARSGELDVKDDIAFELERAGFVGVCRPWFEQDLDRRIECLRPGGW